MPRRLLNSTSSLSTRIWPWLVVRVTLKISPRSVVIGGGGGAATGCEVVVVVAGLSCDDEHPKRTRTPRVASSAPERGLLGMVKLLLLLPPSARTCWRQRE